MRRRLSPDERALWGRVARTVRPIHGHAQDAGLAGEEPHPPVKPHAPIARRVEAAPARRPPGSPTAAVALARATLDGGWDRRLAGGRIEPDRTVDLHGLTLAAAHGRINAEIESAIRADARVLLIITGRARPSGPDGMPGRGAIRRQIADWLAASPHRARIAAIRPAHPRHGGGGAIYLIFRRNRDPHNLL